MTHRQYVPTSATTNSFTCARGGRALAVSLICVIFGGAALLGQPVASQTMKGGKGGAGSHINGESQRGDVGYLRGVESDFHLVLPPFPSQNSKQDGNDFATLQRMQVPDQARWMLAEDDEDMIYPRFSEAFGLELNATRLPILIHLLDRMSQDVNDATFNAKGYFNRPRPFQRYALTHVCGTDIPPQPEAHPQGGSSYPSGHGTWGWGVALALSEIAPNRAKAVLSRAQEYGESRVICGVHFPSDIVGSEILATAVFERLHAVPGFMRDLTCARQEYAAAIQPSSPMSRECSVMERSIVHARNARSR